MLAEPKGAELTGPGPVDGRGLRRREAHQGARAALGDVRVRR